MLDWVFWDIRSKRVILIYANCISIVYFDSVCMYSLRIIPWKLYLALQSYNPSQIEMEEPCDSYVTKI